MSARPYDPMDMGYSYPSFGFPNEPAAVPVAEDDLISELDSILGNTPPLADVEPAQVAQAVPEFDYSNLSTAQIKKLVPYGQVLHLLDPNQIDVLLGENQMNPIDGRAALVSSTTKRFSIPSTKKKFTITATGKKVFWYLQQRRPCYSLQGVVWYQCLVLSAGRAFARLRQNLVHAHTQKVSYFVA